MDVDVLDEELNEVFTEEQEWTKRLKLKLRG